MQATIYDTLLKLSVTKSSLNINCATGNCIFKPFETIGFCSKCNSIADVTPSCQITCGIVDGYDYTGAEIDVSMQSCNISDDFSRLNSSISFNTTCTYPILSEYLSVSLTWNQTANPITYIPNVQHNTSMATGTALGEGFGLLGNISLLGNFLIFGRVMNKGNTTAIDATNVNLIGCAISLCIQDLSTTVTNGVIQQNMLSSRRIESLGFVTDPQSNQGNHLCSQVANEHTVSTGESEFSVDQSNIQSILSFLQEALTASVTAAGPGLISEYTTSGEFADALWLANDLDSLMSNLADRMTDTLRSQSSDPPATGTAYRMEVHVSVKWQWLVLPIALVCAVFSRVCFKKS